MEDVNVLKIDKEDTQRGKYLSFKIEKEKFGLEIKYVVEIIGIQKITEIPQQPQYVKGIINLRGKIVPTVDVRMRFNKNEREYDDRTCIIVVEINEKSVGFVVDRVLEVLEIQNDNISPPPSFTQDYENRYIAGIGKQANDVYILLDCNSLLSSDEMKRIDVIA